MKSRIVQSLLVAVLGVGLISCSSIVKKPEVDKVKKVAILSVFANDKVPEAKGRGFVKGWKANFKMQVAEDFLRVHKKAVSKLGWKVKKSSKVLSSKAYKEAFEIKVDTGNETMDKALSFVGNLAKESNRQKYFTPAGMYPVPFAKSNSSCYGNNCPESPEKKLADFAKKLKVDAVVVVQIDYCYEGGAWTSLGGSGQAFMTAATSIKVVDRNANVVVNMPTVPLCGDSKTRAKSKNSMLMNGGDLVFAFTKNSKVRAMFRQATAKSAKLAVAQIQEAMK